MSDIVQVWQILLQVPESICSHYFTCLSPDEKSRANRFKFADDKRRYVVARGTLRHLLSREFDQRPEAIAFYYSNYGKPFVGKASGASEKTVTPVQFCDGNFHFNLSHSGELAMCVLGYQRQVGIDIERLKPMERLDSMIERCLFEAEATQVKSMPSDEQSRAFLQHWTCKEAYLKAIGLGLTQSMQTVEVQLAPPRLVRVPEDCAEGWHLTVMNLPKEYAEEYVGAVVVAGQATLQMHPWTHP